MGLSGSDNPSDGYVSGPSRKSPAKLDVIDVDALDCDGGGEPSAEEVAFQSLRHAKEPIDVDNPGSWAGVIPASSSSPARAGPPPPLLKFGGALGVALFEQKMEGL